MWMTHVMVTGAALWIGLMQPASPGVAPEESPATIGAPIRTVDELLDALEQADENLQHFTATIRYAKVQGLIGDEQVRKGTVHYRVEPGTGTRQFVISFRQLIIGNALEEEARDFIFDGHWLVERINDEKQFLKREVVRPGEAFDPLSIDGPFPLPIGQKKDDILQRFNAELLPAETEGRLAGYYRLRLTPRRPGDAEDLEQVDLWYDPATLLPGRAVIVEKGGDQSTVDLAGIDTATAADPAMFDTTTPRPEDGWRIEVSRLNLSDADDV